MFSGKELSQRPPENPLLMESLQWGGLRDGRLMRDKGNRRLDGYKIK
jgi:hypothetical protein